MEGRLWGSLRYPIARIAALRRGQAARTPRRFAQFQAGTGSPGKDPSSGLRPPSPLGRKQYQPSGHGRARSVGAVREPPRLVTSAGARRVRGYFHALLATAPHASATVRTEPGRCSSPINRSLPYENAGAQGASGVPRRKIVSFSRKPAPIDDVRECRGTPEGGAGRGAASSQGDGRCGQFVPLRLGQSVAARIGQVGRRLRHDNLSVTRNGAEPPHSNPSGRNL